MRVRGVQVIRRITKLRMKISHGTMTRSTEMIRISCLLIVTGAQLRRVNRPSTAMESVQTPSFCSSKFIVCMKTVLAMGSATQITVTIH